MLSNRVSVDFRKQTVDPTHVSFSTLDKSQTITDLLLEVEVTEVRAVRPSLRALPSSSSRIISLNTRGSGRGDVATGSLCTLVTHTGPVSSEGSVLG